ncbi:MAG: glycosyltransferase family 2 protein [Pyrinomonadaceae bacterium]|nr:glycosyltransferase family 2 protein [Pyrinomonadaceae bacterium]
MNPALSLIVPAYDESTRIGNSLQLIFDYFKDQSYDAEVIVVDDGSTDDTAQTAEKSFAGRGRVEAEVIRVRPNRGKGHAVRVGLLAARAPVAVFSDADLSTPITELPKVVDPVTRGDYDLVFGSRALDRSLIGVHQSWRREQGGRAINSLVKLATGMPFSDTQCGFKAFRMDVCRPVVEAGRIDRFGFDIELLYIAHLAKLRMLEQAVRWDHYEGSKLSPLRDGLRMLNEVREIHANARRGYYDEAVRSASRIMAQKTGRAVFDSSREMAVESDASPHLASPAQRI